MKTSLFPALLAVLIFGGRTMADDKPAPSYTKDVKPFLATYCTECHGTGKPKAGVNLTSYDNLLKQSRKGFIVVASEPDKSMLFRTLNGDAKKMPPAKYSKQPTADEIATIKAWISGGAKDDTPPAEEKKDPPAPGTPPEKKDPPAPSSPPAKSGGQSR